MIPDTELLTPQEAADRCKIHVDRIQEAIRRKELRTVRLGPRTMRVAPSELQRWWTACQNQGVPKK